MRDFIPQNLVVAFLLFRFFQHELAEWSLVRAQGLAGSSAWFGLSIDFAAGVGGFYSYVLLVAYSYDNGWKEAVGLYALSFATILLSPISLAVMRKRIFILWMICIPIFYVIPTARNCDSLGIPKSVKL